MPYLAELPSHLSTYIIPAGAWVLCVKEDKEELFAVDPGWLMINSKRSILA